MKNLYCIPKLDQINNYLDFSRKYNAGFEYNDFFLPAILDDSKRVQDLIHAYTALDRDRSEDTLHGVFLDICVNSDDSRIFAASDLRIHQSMDIAMQLGVKAVVFHTNHIPNFRLKNYQESWLLRNCTYWKTLLAEYPALTIYLENMFDEEPDLLCKLAKAMESEPRFGVCFDFAHAYISHTPLAEWSEALHPYTRHLHINDNDKLEDTHNPVGKGTLPWEDYAAFLSHIHNSQKPTVLIEVRTYKDLMASVSYMKEHHLYPFER